MKITTRHLGPPLLGLDRGRADDRLAAVDTRVLTQRGQSFFVRRFAVEVIDGPDRGSRAVSSTDELSIGADDGVDLRLSDPAVSRHHCTLRATERGLELRDLGSTNGTLLGDAEVVRAYVSSGTRLRLGRTTVVVTTASDEIEEPLAAQASFGGLVGGSPGMRRLYPVLARYAQSDATVLVTGETGTGKEVAAEAIHRASRRANAPFVVVNCGALPPQLAQSELFGHLRGSFTGADVARIGAFEEANRGTLFLDEIGELPLALQPILLRALESKKVRPLGATGERDVDVRVIAATHRDLREAINGKAFRSDLFFRLNVLPVSLPPLRERPGDVEMLAALFWRELRDGEPPNELLAAVASQLWPGNVRELRNAVERFALIGWADIERAETVDTFSDAKEQASASWEKAWLAALLARHGGNLSASARAARMGRSHLRRLVDRYRLRATDDGGDDLDG